MFGFRLSTHIAVTALALVAIAGAAAMLAENARIRDEYLNERRAGLGEALGAEKMRLNHAINELRKDALFLSSTSPVSGIMRAALNRGYDARDGNTLKKWEAQLQQIFSAFINGHPEYYQIRYIGVADEGREIVRVESRGRKAEITSSAELQQKAGRDYFNETMALREGQLYLSEFDLRQEHGVIDLPHMPTLRASVPVFSPDGKIFGMVIINMEARRLFESATLGLPPGAQPYIANMQGQYLLHPDSNKTFTFELGEKGGLTTEFPFLKTMLDPQTADYLPMQAVATSTGNHYLAARRVHFDPGNPSRFLLLAYGIPGAVADGQVPAIPAKRMVGGLIVILLIGGIALFALRRAFAPLEHIVEHIAEAAGKIAADEQTTLAGIRSAIAANDWGKAERMAHTLKGALGAGKLQGKAAELETAIRGRANVQAESLLAEVDAELNQLLDTIDRALQLRAAEKGADGSVADAAPVNMEDLPSLIRQAMSQLEKFDSSVEVTVARIRRMMGGDAVMDKSLASIERHINNNNYGQGLAELTACAESMVFWAKYRDI